MAQGSKDRVYAAAEEISGTRTPTVTAVREAAGVSMADASRYLKEWKNDREDATRQMIAAPAAVIEQGQKLSAAIWSEAVTLAGESHAAVQAQWEQETAALTAEIEELIASADTADAEHRQQIEQAGQALAKANDQAAASAHTAETMREEAQEVREESSELRAKLAAAQATVDTLQKSMDAVLARIPAPAKPAKKPATK